MFVAATLPAESKMSVGAQLQRRFPELRWLNSERLHQGQRTLRHTWLEVDEQGWQTALQARRHGAASIPLTGVTLAATSTRFFSVQPFRVWPRVWPQPPSCCVYCTAALKDSSGDCWC